MPLALVMDEAPAIGIDLGTTNSCAAVLKDDKIVLIHGDDGKNTTASFVFFDGSGSRIVGNLAKDNAYRNIENGIFGTKRFIGRTFDDFKNEKCMSMFPYNVENSNKKPLITIKNKKKETQKYSPEEISGMILGKILECAEKIVRKKVTKAVITVPAHFNGTQRQATIDAGKIAGLEVLRIINEPTAAVLAFEMHNKYKDKSCTLLVYDFGGGTFDVTIATIYNGDIEIKATNGEPYLGGDDLDNNIIDYFIMDFQKKNDIDLRKNPKAYERLRQQAEKTKILLTSAEEHIVTIDCIDEKDELDFECRVSRSIFQQINMPLFEKTVECIEKTLKDAKLNKEDIDEILLVGGSTRIPYVTDLVKNYFDKEPNASIHPDEAVAIGAARQAAMCTAEMHNCEYLTGIQLSDVCSLSLGIEVKEGLMSVIIPRNRKLPTSKAKYYTTSEDNQTNFKIDIYEGERSYAADNKLLVESNLKGIRLAPKGQVKLNVTFNINENGILQVDAQEVGAANSKQIEVSIYSNNLSEYEIQKMIENAEKFKEDDRNKKEISILRNKLDDKLYSLKLKLTNITNPSEKSIIQKTYDDISDWLRTTKNPTLDDVKIKISVIEKYE